MDRGFCCRTTALWVPSAFRMPSLVPLEEGAGVLIPSFWAGLAVRMASVWLPGVRCSIRLRLSAPRSGLRTLLGGETGCFCRRFRSACCECSVGFVPNPASALLAFRSRLSVRFVPASLSCMAEPAFVPKPRSPFPSVALRTFPEVAVFTFSFAFCIRSFPTIIRPAAAPAFPAIPAAAAPIRVIPPAIPAAARRPISFCHTLLAPISTPQIRSRISGPFIVAITSAICMASFGKVAEICDSMKVTAAK